MADAATVRWDRVAGRPLRRVRVGARRPRASELVLVPGLGALGYLIPFVLACAAWTRVHLLDVPGFGHRSTAGCPAGLDDVVGVVATWLDVVPDAPVVLAGHSTGAQAALQAAVRRPEAVSALALCGPTFPPHARTWCPLVGRAARTIVHEPPALVRATALEYLRGGRGVLTLLGTALVDTPEAHIAEVACPVTVLRGARDSLCPEAWTATLADRAANARRATLPGAHNFPYSHPHHTSSALRHVRTV
jgi:pimeloyl-ACP methyl ester carboxylesterase